MYSKITISGKICTGKTTLYQSLQKKLGWPAYSASHFFREYARKHHTLLEKADEQNSTLTKDIDYGMQKMLATKPHLILEGWMTGIMAMEMPDVLRVLLITSEEMRVKRFALREGVSDEVAKSRINERETNLFQKLASIYHRQDFVDPKNYTLVIDTTDKIPEQIVQTVLAQVQ